jgi:hypothetical protein
VAWLSRVFLTLGLTNSYIPPLSLVPGPKQIRLDH